MAENSFENEFLELKNELKNTNEINEKQKELLLLELESTLDKFKQYNENDHFKEVITLLKKEIENKENIISKLNSYIVNIENYIKENERRSNEQITNYENPISNLNNNLNKSNDEITALNNDIINRNDEIDFLKNKIEEYCFEIDKLNDSISKHDEDYKKLINENDKLNLAISDKENQLKIYKEKIGLNFENINNTVNSKLKGLINEKNKNSVIIDELNDELRLLRDKIKFLKDESKIKDNIITSQTEEIKVLKEIIAEKDSDYKNKIKSLENNINKLKSEKNKLTTIKNDYESQLSKLDDYEYQISCLNGEISNNHLEIEYLKNNFIAKKLLSPVAYLFLAIKSNPKELTLNYKLYKAMKNSKFFDIGYYLNNNKDLLESNWCKYFSPELHYVCHGFDEQRKFNKKYFNLNSKKELLDYILNCK